MIGEVLDKISSIRSNPWLPRAPLEAIVLWSDASDKKWGAILDGDHEKIAQGPFPLAQVSCHIYIKEIYAAKQAVVLASKFRSDVTAILYVDNLSAVHTIERGHSSNFMANQLLCQLFTTARSHRISIKCIWVNTHDQKADKYTRGVIAPHPIPLED